MIKDLKMLCQKCKGNSTREYDYYLGEMRFSCLECEGFRYVPASQQILDDLELVSAVKAAVSSGVRIIFAECNPEKWLVKNEKTGITMKLLDWHRKQKGGNL